MRELLKYKDVEVVLEGTLLVIRNSRICRKLDMSTGAPKTVSLTDSRGVEYAFPEKVESGKKLFSGVTEFIVPVDTRNIRLLQVAIEK